MIKRITTPLLIVCALLAGSLSFAAKPARNLLAQALAKKEDPPEAERLKIAKARFETELLPRLREKGLTESPKFVVLAFFKDRRVVELYAGDDDRHLELIKTYPVTAASGKPGPKLKEGDKQVPEGVYEVEGLNPGSNYFLSLRVGYPNRTDLEHAKEEGRTGLGGDIMIHGKRVSVGCIALGDDAIAEVFQLALLTPSSRWKLLLAPTDLRSHSAPSNVLQEHPWMGNVYDDLLRELQQLPSRDSQCSFQPAPDSSTEPPAEPSPQSSAQNSPYWKLFGEPAPRLKKYKTD